MRIIVEGMDNTGKSTLALKLAERFGAVYLKTHNKPTSLNQVYDYHRWILDSRLPVVLDRVYWISDPVYGMALRGKSVVPIKDTIHLSSYYSVIYCRPPEEFITNWGSRDQMEGVIQRAPNLIRMYDSLMTPAIINPTLCYDFTKRTFEEVCHAL